MSRVGLSVDIGGTFTDVAMHARGQVFAAKTLTTHEDLLTGFFRGVELAMAQGGISPAEVDGALVHSTTVVTNALIERNGARTAMVFTKGFRDTLRLRDGRRYDLYDTQIDYPEPLVSDELTFELAERVFADGTIGVPVDEDEVRSLAGVLQRAGVVSVGICFLNSYKNGANEVRAAEILSRTIPQVFVSTSSEIAPQMREYLRASTAMVNAYAVPITRPYLDALNRSMREKGFGSGAVIMLSSGGAVGPGAAGRMPVRMLESGPAAGVLGASIIARSLGLEKLFAFDMGGTTAKICLIDRSEPRVAGQFEIDRMFRYQEGSGLPVAIPCIDLIEIGAGGGSIAYRNELGLLNVGPRSTGSFPGSACYGLGGVEPTVTDADVVLGLIGPDTFLGGAMTLDVAAADAALGRLGSSLDRSAVEAARGIYKVVTESMAAAVRVHAAERGVDYRGVPILASGGAGPLHACEIARLLGSSTVIFPPHASVLAALGGLLTPLRIDLFRTYVSPLSGARWDHVARCVEEMEAEALSILVEANCRPADVGFSCEADLRYVGQQDELKIKVDRQLIASGKDEEIRALFEEEYLRTYRITQPGLEVEIVALRIAGRGPEKPVPRFDGSQPEGTTLEAPRRNQHAWPDWPSVPVFRRASLPRSWQAAGPMFIEDEGTTLVIPPHWDARIDRFCCVVANARTRMQ